MDIVATRWAAPLGAALAVVPIIGVAYAVAPRGSDSPGTAEPTTSESHVSSNASASPTTSPSPEVVRDVVSRQRADVDGDGDADRVTLLFVTVGAFPDSTQKVELKVELAFGETASVDWPREYEWGLDRPRDFDGDGDVEIVATGGGGEFGILRLYDIEEGPLRAIASVDAGGKRMALTSSGGSTDWESTLLGNGDLVDFRWLSEDPGPLPFTVKFRRWTLNGMALILSSTMESGCYDVIDYRAQITPGEC
jgi:hypothetical protein